MKKAKLIIILNWLPFLLLQAQEINVSYNYSAVQKLVEILDSGKLTEKNFTELKIVGFGIMMVAIPLGFAPRTGKEVVRSS